MKRTRKPRIIGTTPASDMLYRLFIRPFTEQYTVAAADSRIKTALHAFFGIHYRSIFWCRALADFTIPGKKWESESRPYKHISGEGNRKVRRGNAIIVREDIRTPDVYEIEFRDQMFVLTKSQFKSIEDYIKKIA